MFGHGSGSCISRHLGAKEIDKARKYSSTGFFLAAVSGIIITRDAISLLTGVCVIFINCLLALASLLLCCVSFILSPAKDMPHGTATELLREFDDEGIMLSGGEAQKIAVSRAFYKNCPYVIMDEPSANLDPVAEYNLNKAMMEAAENKTVIFISHRLSIFINCLLALASLLLCCVSFILSPDYYAFLYFSACRLNI